MNRKIGLICEGGGTKAAYTAGALLAFLDHDILIPYTVGISAAVEILLPYVSRQRDRLRITGIDSPSQKSAVGIIPLIKEGGIFGIDATCDYIEKRAPLDFKSFYESSTQLETGLYNIDTGQIEYFDKSYVDEDMVLVKAACALLLLAHPYKFKGKMYMDAGLIDMIPIFRSIEVGNEKHIIISTKEENYVRKPAPNWQVSLANIRHRKQKHVGEDLKKRHVRYKEQWDKVKELERDGKALVLRPSKDMGVTRYTTDRNKLEPWFNLGYQDTVERLDMIKKFMNE